MFEIVRLTLKQMFSPWRLIIVVFLSSLPTLLWIVVNAFTNEQAKFDDDMINAVIDGMIIGAIMPIITMTLATSAFSNEVEDKTLQYLVLKPVSRLNIILSKLFATLLISIPLTIACGLSPTLLSGGSAKPLFVLTLGLLSGVIAYSAIFTWLGLITNQALGFALVYVLMWEGILSTFLSGIRYLSIRGYTLAILNGMDDKGFEILESRVIEFPAAVVGTISVTLVFIILAYYRLRTMDVT